jgi:hypothetical protein
LESHRHTEQEHPRDNADRYSPFDGFGLHAGQFGSASTPPLSSLWVKQSVFGSLQRE